MSYGGYVVADQWLWREAGADDQGLAFFAQYSWAPPHRAEAPHHLGGGLTWTGAVPGRDEDVLGLAAFHVAFSPRLRRPHDETAIELLYSVAAAPWLRLVVDGQAVLHPGGTRADTAFVLGLRAVIAF